MENNNQSVSASLHQGHLDRCIAHLKATDPTDSDRRHQQFNEWSDEEFRRCRLEKDAARRYQTMMLIENKLDDEHKRRDDDNEKRKRAFIQFMEVFDSYYQSQFQSSLLKLVCLHFGESPTDLSWNTVLGQDNDLMEAGGHVEVMEVEEDMLDSDNIVLQKASVEAAVEEKASPPPRLQTPELPTKEPVLPTTPTPALRRVAESCQTQDILLTPPRTSPERDGHRDALARGSSVMSTPPSVGQPPTSSPPAPPPPPPKASSEIPTPRKITTETHLGKRRDHHGNPERSTSDSIEFIPRGPRSSSHHGYEKRQKRSHKKPLTWRTITYNEVYDDGKAHDEITEFPPGSGHHYIFQCNVPGHRFSSGRLTMAKDGQLRRSAPIRGAAVHCGHRHGTDRTPVSAIQEIGYFVTGCDIVKQEINNRAYDSRYWEHYNPTTDSAKTTGQPSTTPSRQPPTQLSSFTPTKRRIISSAEYFASRSPKRVPEQAVAPITVPEIRVSGDQAINSIESDDEEPLVRSRRKRLERYAPSTSEPATPTNRRAMVLPNQPRLGQRSTVNGPQDKSTRAHQPTAPPSL